MAAKNESLTIEWTLTAERQLFQVLHYWIDKTGSTVFARKLSNAVWERAMQISKNPYSAVQTTFPGTRKVAMGHYSMFYKVMRHKIVITAFWDNRQDPEKLYSLLSLKSKPRS